MAKTKSTIVTNHSLIKNFSYGKGDVSLVFSLDLNDKKGILDFLELLVDAVDGVREEIKPKEVQ
jgi:hypothetical protein